MPALRKYPLSEIERRLQHGVLPFSGISEKGSCEFHFREPSYYAGVVLHAGSRIRHEIMDAMAVPRSDRFREEDPFMDAFVRELPIQLIARDSRFEYDLNREPDRAFYPFDSLKWGMRIWCRELSSEKMEPSLAKHREFHDLLDLVTGHMLRQNRFAVIFDMHSYCYQREKKRPWYEDPRPEINLGTKAVNRELFRDAIESFLEYLSGTMIGGHPVRAAENEIFKGGYLSRRISSQWHERVLVLALEYKKIFMDEWSGEVYKDILSELVKDFRRAADRLVSPGIFSPPKK
jgi:N-formylglutamate amidohydrolase